jgi:metal-responsive CopG/Arc/MetJ family transcriptional regulator
MKTAVSLPDDIFNEAERAARKAGISRSEFYANAIRTYLDASRKERLTESLNTFYDSFVQEPDPFLRRAAEIQSMRDDLP